MKTIKIYQLKSGIKYKFKSYLFARENGFTINDYNCVYEYRRRSDYKLDDVFYEFNIHHPDDFRGHSLSVSDIVEMDGIKWYCDDIGWSRILEEK